MAVLYCLNCFQMVILDYEKRAFEPDEYVCVRNPRTNTQVQVPAGWKCVWEAAGE